MGRSTPDDIIELIGERIRLLAPSTVAQLVTLRQTYENSFLVTTGLMSGTRDNKQHSMFNNSISGLMNRSNVKLGTEPVWLATYRVAEFRSIVIRDGHVRIGSALSISDLRTALVQTNSNNKFSSLIDLLDRYSSRQIRNTSVCPLSLFFLKKISHWWRLQSWVGNVTSGNPTSDLTIAFLALNAHVSVIDIRTGQKRDVLVDESFFQRSNGRRNCLGKDDVICSVSIALLSEV